jgi:hypothetical protein
LNQLKQQLTELIDAYGTARVTGNQLLTQAAASSLVEFLESVVISSDVAVEPSEAEPAPSED